jgi:RNA polymerase sigma-70 factor (ECF subfamily)
MKAAHASLRPLEPSDGVLAERAARGDERALGQLYQRHARYVAGVAHRLLGNDDVDDIVQETFLAAAEHLASLRDTEAIRPWLARIAARKVMLRFSTRSRFQRFLGSLVSTAATRSEPHVVHAVSALARALEQLPPAQRIPWVLHRVEGETLPEVASVVGASLATVKRRIAEADARLSEWRVIDDD